MHPTMHKSFYREVTKLETELILAIKMLGMALILLIIGIVLCFLASLGYSTYIKCSNKKNEVHAENSNKNDTLE